jgi:hypothetical protein
MSPPTPEGREIDSRLEELDRRLRAVQDELLPEREPRPVRGVQDAPRPPDAPPPPAEPPRPPDPPPPPPARLEPAPAAAAIPSPASVTTAHSKLVSSLRELLGAYESLLGQFPAPAADRPTRPAPEPQSISAGPFPSTGAVRAFRDSLASLPGVETVVIRAYEGQDRAIFDLKLTEPRRSDGSA